MNDIILQNLRDPKKFKQVFALGKLPYFTIAIGGVFGVCLIGFLAMMFAHVITGVTMGILGVVIVVIVGVTYLSESSRNSQKFKKYYNDILSETAQVVPVAFLASTRTRPVGGFMIDTYAIRKDFKALSEEEIEEAKLNLGGATTNSTITSNDFISTQKLMNASGEYYIFKKTMGTCAKIFGSSKDKRRFYIPCVVVTSNYIFVTDSPSMYGLTY